MSKRTFFERLGKACLLRQSPRDKEQHLLREGRGTNSQLCGRSAKHTRMAVAWWALPASATISLSVHTRCRRCKSRADACLGVGGASRQLRRRGVFEKTEAQREGRSRAKRHEQEENVRGGERRRNEQKEQEVRREEMRREESRGRKRV